MTDNDSVVAEAIEDASPPGRILVAGLGNSLLMDDGVGVHAAAELAREGLDGVVVAEVGVAVLDALHLFEQAERILAIDAMQAGGTPGTIYQFGIDDVAEGEIAASLHELSLRAALRFIPQAHPAITILGVEPAVIDYGLDLSPQVATAMPLLLGHARRILADWRRQAGVVPTGSRAGGTESPGQ